MEVESKFTCLGLVLHRACRVSSRAEGLKQLPDPFRGGFL